MNLLNTLLMERTHFIRLVMKNVHFHFSTRDDCHLLTWLYFYTNYMYRLKAKLNEFIE